MHLFRFKIKTSLLLASMFAFRFASFKPPSPLTLRRAGRVKVSEVRKINPLHTIVGSEGTATESNRSASPTYLDDDGTRSNGSPLFVSLPSSAAQSHIIIVFGWGV